MAHLHESIQHLKPMGESDFEQKKHDLVVKYANDNSIVIEAHLSLFEGLNCELGPCVYNAITMAVSRFNPIRCEFVEGLLNKEQYDLIATENLRNQNDSWSNKRECSRLASEESLRNKGMSLRTDEER